LIHYDKACDMTFKCLQAQRAGAMMAIVIHPTNNPDSLMLKEGRYSDSLKIACFSITKSQGDSIRAMLPSYVGIFKPEIKPDVKDSTQMVKKDLIAPEVLNNNIGSIAISPNPARDIVGITYLLYDVPEAKIEVVNSMGQVVHRQILRGGASGTLDMDVQRWSNGVYIVELSYGEKVMRQKLIVQH
jgi:Secretion system C-terminal sorting domain